MARLRWASGIALVALTVTACGMGGDDNGNNGGSGEGEGSGGGHLVYAEQFAPAAAWAIGDQRRPYADAGPAVWRRWSSTAHDGELEPMLATEWSQVEPTTWEFTLREGVTFQDGTPMDAEAVAGALTHVLEVETPARAFNADVISGVEAIDESTVQVTTPKPDPLVPLRVASPNAGILAPKAYEGEQIDIKGTCTGPFTVTEEVPRESLTLEANDELLGRRGRPAIRPRCGSSSTAPPGPPSCRPGRRRSPRRSRWPASPRWRATTTWRSPSWS